MTSSEPPQRGSFAVLAERVDCDTVVYFRIVFAIVAFLWVAKQFTSGAIDVLYAEPRLHFHYFGFRWVNLVPGDWTRVEFACLGIAAVLIGIGACYRLATLVFALGFTHLFLADKCLYQNHYYLICLVAWIMVFLPANRAIAIDAWLQKSATQTVPRWVVWLLRFQLGVPYFFGGIAKLNADWLAGEPMRLMLNARTGFPVLGPFFDREWCVYLMAYGALLFDLLVVPALLTKRFRVLACVVAISFHGLNSWLFTIGVFPWFMLLTLPIFFAPGSLRIWFSNQPIETESDEQPCSKVVAILLVVFVLWQSLFPLRHYLIPGSPNWTEEGHYFAWHMLLRGKQSALRYTATAPKKGKRGAVDLRPYVTPFQLNRVSRDPRLIHELARYIGDDLRSLGFDEVELRALCLVSMNGRKPQLLVDPKVDLLRSKQRWSKPEWIKPLTEPLRHPHWDVPIAEWEQRLGDPVQD